MRILVRSTLSCALMGAGHSSSEIRVVYPVLEVVGLVSSSSLILSLRSKKLFLSSVVEQVWLHGKSGTVRIWGLGI